jgi:queuine tRNA-ribosyltransferase
VNNLSSRILAAGGFVSFRISAMLDCVNPIDFKIEKKLPRGRLGRAGVLTTPHGIINTPAFVTVGTKATVKSVSPEQLKDLGAQVVLANTYHLYLEPGEEILRKAGGLGKFMNWSGPTMTDSGGFQVFSLGAAYGKSVSKIASKNSVISKIKNSRVNGLKNDPEIYSQILKNLRIDFVSEIKSNGSSLADIDEDGVNFKSPIDGSSHRFTPERSIEIQHSIGADMIFAFDECTSPDAPYEYQKEAMGRTHRWAARCYEYHKSMSGKACSKIKDEVFFLNPKPSTLNPALFGIVQGGRFEDLRKFSAKKIGVMDFDGFGIGGSFDKDDMGTAVKWVNKILPEEKPRHLLGIGEPADLFTAVENGCDLFDCVSPTRRGRNGSLYTAHGLINILNAKFTTDFSPIEKNCACYVCQNYTCSYLAHLFRSKEIFANTLATIHNLYFIVNLVARIRQSILDGNFSEFKEEFLRSYSR